MYIWISYYATPSTTCHGHTFVANKRLPQYNEHYALFSSVLGLSREQLTKSKACPIFNESLYNPSKHFWQVSFVALPFLSFKIELKGFLQQRWEAGISGAGINTIIGEDTIATTLRSNFPRAIFIQVNDVSGGCGAMFEVSVEAPEFKGLSIIKQHRLVTAALSEQIKNMHGIRIQTTVPPDTDNKN